MLSSSTSSSPLYTQAPSRQNGAHNSHALGHSSPATLPCHTMYEKVKVTYSRSRQYQTPLWQNCGELIASSPSEWLEHTLRSDGKKRCSGGRTRGNRGLRKNFNHENSKSMKRHPSTERLRFQSQLWRCARFLSSPGLSLFLVNTKKDTSH